jgi:hypothetical protein
LGSHFSRFFRDFSAEGKKTMGSASFEEVPTIDERGTTSKSWQPGWGTIVIVLAILQLLLSIMLDR